MLISTEQSEMIKLKLKSDFTDYYDMGFDDNGLSFSRMTTDGPTRPEMFRLLRSLKIPTPFHGYYEDFKDKGFTDEPVVVHDDVTAHCGYGKRLIKFSELRPDEDCFIVEWVPTTVNGPLSGVRSHSFRYLIVGDRYFRYEYISLGDWRSNCGDGDIIGCHEIYANLPAWRNKVYAPLIAIDFVGPEHDMKAIDWNVSPGLWGTGVNKYMSSASVIFALKHWFMRVANERD